MSKVPTDFFTKEHAERYDERNLKLGPISENLYFLTKLILQNLPSQAKILSVGAGTGAEIISLAKAFPNWTFVAVDPSLSMIDICRARVREEGFLDRCDFIHGYCKDVPLKENFDASLAFFVAHFVGRNDRLNFYKDLTDRLRIGGHLVNAEISFDLNSKEFPSMLTNWKSIQQLMGATPESLATLPKNLKEVLTVLPPAETESLIQSAGIETPVRFFQSFMISAWYGLKGT